MSRVHCVVPVHNRLDMTRLFVEQMRQQDYPALRVVIVDDGSVDGTGEFLAALRDPRVTVIRGSGSMWWGGAINLGMREVFAGADNRDYLLMLNDDVRVGPHYVSHLVEASRAHGGAVVGSAQRFETSGEAFGAAYRIDYWRMRYVAISPRDTVTAVDALPGRGVLIPMSLARAAGLIHRGLPHHLGDLEYTARVKERGGVLIVSPAAEILTYDPPPAAAAVRSKPLHRWLGPRSPDNLWHRMVFFHSRGPVALRVVAAPRYALLALLRRLGVAG